MNRTGDRNSSGPEQSPDPDPAKRVGLTGWLDALNAYLERVNKADLDTGC